MINFSLQTIAGSVWSKNKLEAKAWEIEAGFRITGRGRVGADGMVHFGFCFHIQRNSC